MKPGIIRELAALSSRLSSLVVEVAEEVAEEAKEHAAPRVEAPPPSRGDEVLSVAEIAAQTRFTRRHVYDQIAAGHLRATKIGKYHRSRQSWVDEWIAGGGGDADGATAQGNKMLQCANGTHERRHDGPNGKHH